MTFDTKYFVHSTAYFKETGRIKRALEKNHINYLFLKGLPLYLYIQKSLPERLFADCDLLIDKQDKYKTERIFKKEGYRQIDIDPSDIGSLHRDIQKKYFVRKKGYPVMFDIHYEIVFTFVHSAWMNLLFPRNIFERINKDLLAHIRKVKVQGKYFPMLSKKHLILYLALHFLHHNYRGVFRLRLLDQVIRKEGGKQVLLGVCKKANEYKVAAYVYPVFALLKKYFQTPLPSNFLSKLEVSKRQKKYISKEILRTSVFDELPHFKAGIERFWYLFHLSPVPLLKRLFLFVHPVFVLFIFRVIASRIIRKK